jgi:Amt family ammonium transporter
VHRVLRRVSLNSANDGVRWLLIVIRDYIARLDGFSVIKGGWLNHHWIQMGYQLSNSFAGGFYSFFASCLILGMLDFLGKWIPPLKLRATEEEEIAGIDDVEIGEFAYDYVELSREVKSAGDDGLDGIDGMSRGSGTGGADELKSYESMRPFGRARFGDDL